MANSGSVTAAKAYAGLRVAITGSSSGLGLEFVRQYAAQGARVYALCRDPSAAVDLRAVAESTLGGEVTLHPHDQASSESCAAVAAEFADVPLDMLVNNAGVGGSPGARSSISDFGQEGQQFGAIDYEAWGATMNTNVLGVMRTVEALAPSLLSSPSPRLVHIAGVFGSITNQVRVGEASPDMAERRGKAGHFIYRSSKAAMNMVCKMLDVELAPRGVASLALHPGPVQTRLTEKLGKYPGSITPEVAVGNMLKLIDKMDVSNGLEYVMHDGRRLQW